MSIEGNELTDFQNFVAEVQSKIPVDELYTKLTGEQFEKVASRHRARIVWREDKSPSLSYYAQENILTDFTTINPETGKYASYGPVQLLLKCGGALSFSHALQMACDITQMDIPDKFQRVDKDGKSITKKVYFAGPKLKEVWDLCKANLETVILDKTKRPINLIKFFEARNIPMDINFVRATNIGLLPKIDIVKKVLKDTELMKQGKGKELDIFYEDFGDNALVFPLYTIDGALAGIRSRKFTEKNFTQWKPLEDIPCFYNMDKFRFRPSNHRIMIVEGEMNLIAYAIAAYHEVKDNGKVEQDLRDALPIIYASGSKTNHLDIFHGELDRVVYIQDNDIKSYDEIPDPLKHPILNTVVKIANEIKSNDLLVVNWEEVKHATSKYDLEDYLKFNNYSLGSIRDLPLISLPRYCFNTIKHYVDTIDNQDNKRECQVKFSFEVSDKLQNAQRQVFNEIAEKEFSLSAATTASLKNNDRGITCGDLSVDELGRIIQSVPNDNGVRVYTKTNFYLKISNATHYYSLDNKLRKTYTVQVVIGGLKSYEGELDADKYFDNQEIQKFLANLINVTDLQFVDPSWKGKGFSNVTDIMHSIPNDNVSYVFSSLGRPTEVKTIELFKTNKFFLMPDVSVINGEVVENNGFKVSVDNTDSVDKTKFKFKKVDDDEYREVGSLFWNHLRHLHETTLIDTVVSVIFDSCTREIQGTGIVENDHGFPLYLSGQSGGFKSTAAVAGMCLLGDFKNQSDLLSCNGTTLAWVHQLMAVGTATHCLDDLKVEDLRDSEFVNLFHNIYGGATRARMDSTGTKLKGGDKMRASAIFTSEAKPGDIPESIAARMLCLRIVKPAYSKTAEWETHLLHMTKPKEDGSCNFHRMSAFLPRAIAWVQQRDIKPYAKCLDKWKKHYTDLLRGKGNNIERPADMVSRIISAWENITEFCKEKEICTPQEADQAFKNLVDFWDLKIIDQISRIEAHSSKFKIIDILVQILKSEAIGVKTFNGGWKDPKRNYPSFPILDITYPDDRGRKLIVLATKAVLSVMNNYMENGHRIVEDKFREDLKEAGVIETDLVTGKAILYPIPNERGSIDEKKLTSSLAIDYNALMRLYEGLKK